jgi:vacuolar-type H+-ATPase subunit I/STV1
VFLNKEKICFCTLNKLKKGEKLSLGYCWIPRCELEKTLSVVEGIKANNSNIELPTLQIVHNHGIKPPTMFKTNEFTAGF